MPLVTGGKKVASLYAEIGANTAPFETGAKVVKSELGTMKKSLSAVGPLGAVQFATVAAAVTAVGVAIGDALQDQIAYANEVRQLSTISDISAESASRLIQVMDDYKLTQADLLLGAKAMREQGLVPTIETMAQLSDQYLAIHDPAEKMNFLAENFGSRAGVKFAEVMNKGSAALLEQNSAIAKNLILTQKMVDDARKAEIAVDTWGDAVKGLKTEFATGLLPVLTKGLQNFNAHNRAMEILIEQGKQASGVWSQDYQVALEQANEEQAAMTESMLQNAEAIDINTISAEENAAMLKEITDLNRGLIGVIGDIQGATEDFNETNAELNEERIEIERKRAEEVAKGWAMDSEKIAEYDAALAENTQKTLDNQAEFDRANKEILSGLSERILLQDGVLTDDEVNWLINKRVEWGLYSEDVAAEARKVIAEANSITQGIANIPTSKDISINVNYVQTGGELSPDANGGAYVGHANGGDFLIPASYGNEGFALGNGDTASAGERVSITPAGAPMHTKSTDNSAAMLRKLDELKPNYEKLARAVVSRQAAMGG